MDITNFMTWFLNQVVNIFTFCYSTLDSITFMGTSLFKVILTIGILSALLPVILTLVQRQSIGVERRTIRERRKNNDN